MREQGRSKTGHVKLAPMRAPGPTGERQEHLDAIISFAGAGQRRRLLRGLDVLQWAIGDPTDDCRFLLNTQEGPNCYFFCDDEWLRSSTEAQEISIDIPEEAVTHDQQAVDPKKIRPIQVGEFLRKYVSRRLLTLSEGEIASLVTAMRQLGVGSEGGAEALATTSGLLAP